MLPIKLGMFNTLRFLQSGCWCCDELQVCFYDLDYFAVYLYWVYWHCSPGFNTCSNPESNANSGNCNPTPTELSTEQKCINSGGTVRTALCCLSTTDFPNTCLIGACGCSPANSHEVKVCECQEGKCFDGNRCVNRTAL